ncbi:MAG: type II secretion system F family protein [Patescibacteria group bacterium]
MMTVSRQLKEFWNSFAVLINLGVPVSSILIILTEGIGGGPVGRAVKSIIEGLNTGSTLSAEMAKTRMFSKVELNMVRGGEIGGMLDVVISRIASGKMTTMASQYERFWTDLHQLLSCGVPILSAIEISSAHCEDLLKEAIKKIRNSVKEGEVFSKSMKESGMFSELEITLIDVGEETGTLDSAIQQIVNLC